MDSAAVNTRVQISLQDPGFNSFGSRICMKPFSEYVKQMSEMEKGDNYVAILL